MVRIPDGADFTPDIRKLGTTWPGKPPIKKFEDTLTVTVDLKAMGAIHCPTHTFGETARIIPYDDTDGTRTLDRRSVARGDQELARWFPPGTIGFAIKHHRPEHRILTPDAAEKDLKEHLKLQDSHLGLVVGVERDGEPGVITLNNPQDYANGRFGPAQYPMIFVKPRYPGYLSEELQRHFTDNIRTMMVCFNLVSQFPAPYNGGDPLGAFTPRKVREHVEQMLLAIAGDGDQKKAAKAWFERREHKIYCAELAHVAASAGLLVPLNWDHCVPLVGEKVWRRFCVTLRRHGQGEETSLTTENRNELVKYVSLTRAPRKLRPMYAYAPEELRAREMKKISFRPMTMADILDHAMRVYFPREKVGECLAPIQAMALRKMRQGLLESMKMDDLPPGDPKRKKAEELYDEVIHVVGKEHKSYERFRAELTPFLKAARSMTGPRPGSRVGQGYFVPPSLFHLIAGGRHPGGLLELDYVGHGLHFSLVRTQKGRGS